MGLLQLPRTHTCNSHVQRQKGLATLETYTHECSLVPRLTFVRVYTTHVKYLLSVQRYSYKHTTYMYILYNLYTQHSPRHVCWDLLLSQVTLSQCHDDHLHWHSGEQSSGTVKCINEYSPFLQWHEICME